MALVYANASRNYTVTTAEKTLLVTITKANFAKFLEVAPTLKVSLLRATKKFLLTRYRSMMMPVIAYIDDERLEKASQLSEIRHYEKGHEIFRQGQPGTAFYLVLDGEVRLETKQVAKRSSVTEHIDEAALHKHEAQSALVSSFCGDASSRVLEPGQYFGEVAVLLPHCDTVGTATAMDNATLLRFDKDAFHSLFSHDINIRAEMILKLLQKETPLRISLEHAKCRSLFEAQLKKEFADECLEFYDKAAGFMLDASDLDAADQKSLVECCHELCEEYVVSGAPKEINIPSHVRGAVLKARPAAADESDRTLSPALVAAMRKCRQEIYTLMSKDNYARFVGPEGEAFTALLADIGSYATEIAHTGLVADCDLEAASSQVIEEAKGHVIEEMHHKRDSANDHEA